MSINFVILKYQLWAAGEKEMVEKVMRNVTIIESTKRMTVNAKKTKYMVVKTGGRKKVEELEEVKK
jgi:hypothetical protein